MNKYTIYCTAEQTKKALELGVPLFEAPYVGYFPVIKTEDDIYYEVPTAEQMLGWLRSQGFRFCINDLEESTHWDVTIDDFFAIGELSTPKEATLAAIDAVLDYLIK